MNYFYVAIGAIAGCYSRYVISHLSPASTFPIDTLFVNSIGSFLLGIVVFHKAINEKWRHILGVGYFGSFTTFSTFTYDYVQLLQNGQYVIAFSYIVGSVMIGIGGAFLG
ncbi:MAG: fluoride efflux transporter CrcB, partial [Lysinibacillus sp.]